MVSLSAIIVGYLLDLALGDPQNWPHPVRWIGRLINVVQTKVRHHCRSDSELRWGGLVLWATVVGAAYIASWAILTALAPFPWLQWIAETVMIYTVLATKCLSDAANDVYRVLQGGSLAEARVQLSYIVGRDTSQLSAEQISRATVETVAENSVDGVIAPLFFLFIGGVPLAMAYKAVNTLDSMVGYKTPKYQAIGYFSARIDDVANFIPARLSWLLLTAAAAIEGMDYRRALRLGWRDRYQHKSPNCAWSEATVAGALGVRLGGPNVYFGQWVEKPWLGDSHRDIEAEDIRRCIRLMYIASALALVSFSAVSLLF
jgi:adenosylcobinamide-phosphate synthase